MAFLFPYRVSHLGTYHWHQKSFINRHSESPSHMDTSSTFSSSSALVGSLQFSLIIAFGGLLRALAIKCQSHVLYRSHLSTPLHAAASGRSLPFKAFSVPKALHMHFLEQGVQCIWNNKQKWVAGMTGIIPEESTGASGSSVDIWGQHSTLGRQNM